MKRSVYILALLLTGCSVTYENVKLDQGFMPSEPSITINPTNPDNVVAGAIMNSVYVSNDGGKTWTESKMESESGVYGDPCLIADWEGNIYYFSLSDPEGIGWASEGLLDRIVCQVSSDGGKTWPTDSYMGLDHPKDQDKEWAIADKKTGNIYCTWTQFDLYDSKDPNDSTHILFSYSDDKGDNWSTPTRINQLGGDCLDGDQTVEGAVPAVDKDGNIYVAWSFDEKIWFDRSYDKGITWQEKDIVAADQPGGWNYDVPGINRCNGLPVTVCDVSDGPHAGTIYINWTDQRNGEDDTDVWMVKSTDQGNTWSEPIRINDDEPGAHQFLTWMTVDPVTGYLYCVFYDRRGLEGIETNVYLAYSKDGGETFTNVKISESSFKPGSMIFFGDYTNISAYDGRVRPIWARADGNTMSIWTALVEMD